MRDIQMIEIFAGRHLLSPAQNATEMVVVQDILCS
jgi:hypothetical protein